MQVGYVGLLKAINNFDPSIGGNLAAYAQPCISGEIKRHFRDKRWQVHVKRSAQELLLRAGVTTVADAAFQDHVWRPRLEPLRGLAHLRIVHCVVTHDVAFQRVLRRGQDSLVRRAHADPRPGHDLAEFARHRAAFDRVSVEAPWMEVDTTDGYKPGLD